MRPTFAYLAYTKPNLVINYELKISWIFEMSSWKSPGNLLEFHFQKSVDTLTSENLNILQWNCHSLYSKLTPFKIHLYAKKPHIVCLI